MKKTRSSSKELRDEAQRTRILDAAISCVVRRGFHAASMAELARSARMSVGQIYRYFANKEAIVQAVVRRMVARRIQWIATQAAAGVDIAAGVARRLLEGGPELSHDDQVLMLEITVEATRNPVVAQIVREADAELIQTGLAVMRQSFPSLSDDELRDRIELIAALDAGAEARRLNGLNAGTVALRRIYEEVIEQVLRPDCLGQRGSAF